VLLEHLAEIARAHDVEEFEADVLGENNAMLAVFLRSGYRVTRALEQGVFHLSFPTETTVESTAVQQRRDRAAAAASVRGFLAPRGVAVVGASARSGSLGGALLERLRRGGFRGAIHPVNPAAAPINDLPAVARVSDAAGPVDLALIAVPAHAVEAVVADCARAGVRGLVVASGGFAETGADGRAAQQRLAALVRESGMRLVGPGSMGILNTDPTVSLDATAGGVAPAAGRVGLLAQSGAIGIALLERCARLGIGLSSFVSVGNKADVSGNDLLAYWAEDPRTTAVLLLEASATPRKFAQLAPTVARRTDRRGRGPVYRSRVGRRRRRPLRAGRRDPHRHPGGALRGRRAARASAGSGRRARRRRRQRLRNRGAVRRRRNRRRARAARARRPNAPRPPVCCRARAGNPLDLPRRRGRRTTTPR
jgi:succinyl-CoA synthetase alpha subunit